MKALISPDEKIYNYDDPPIAVGVRVCDVEAAEFPVAAPLFWVGCESNIVAGEFYYDNGSFYPVPVKPKPPEATAETGPVVI
jgi:hypothetical protein